MKKIAALTLFFAAFALVMSGVIYVKAVKSNDVSLTRVENVANIIYEPDNFMGGGRMARFDNMKALNFRPTSRDLLMGPKHMKNLKHKAF